jgi:hypothetical protein
VALLRALCLGNVGPATAVHAGYLVAMGLIGLTVAGHRVSRLLLR